MKCWSCGKPSKRSTCPACERKRDKIRREVEGIDVFRGRNGKVFISFSIEPEPNTHIPPNEKE